MNIKVWSNFSKRKNSTKQPTGGSTITVTLKDQCSILSPVFILNTLDFTINYVEAFGHYYFADVTNLDGNRSEISCTLDYLASFKSNISAYSGLVEYTSASSDLTITDPRNYPTGDTESTYTALTLTGITFNDTVGTYIIAVLSDKAEGVTGCCQYYAMLPAQMESLCQRLFSSSLWSNVEDQFTGSRDGLVSCIWLPIDITDIPGDSDEHVYIGREDMMTYGKKISNRVIMFSATSTNITFPTGAGGDGALMKYIDKAPYVTAQMYLPFIGWVPLSDDLLAAKKSISLLGWVDILTGDIVYSLSMLGSRVASFNGTCATKMPVAGASYDGVGAVTSAITAIGGAAAVVATVATGGGLAPLAAAAATAVGAAANSVAKSCTVHTMINGSNSSALAARMGLSPVVAVIRQKPIESNLLAYQAEQGMPYFKTATLSSLSGYIKCANASIEIPGDGAEQDAVNSYLNSGFYLE